MIEEETKQWIKDRKLPLNNCGKIIVPTKTEQDYQLELLLKRGKKNGATVEILDENQLKLLTNEISELIKSDGIIMTKEIEIAKVIERELDLKINLDED